MFVVSFLKNTSFWRYGLFVLSFIIIAFGQPSKAPLLCILAASCGFSIFWLALTEVKGSVNKFLHAFCWYFLISSVQLSWMTSIQYQGIYILIVYALLNAFLALQFSLLALWVMRNHSHYFLQAAAVASAWTLMEWSRMWLFCGFTWNPVGLALAFPSLPLQTASLLGIYGLSFWVVFTNVLFYQFLKKKILWKIAICACAFPYLMGALLFGFQSLSSISAHLKTLKLGIVQTGLKPSEKCYLSDDKAFIHPHLQWEKILTYLKETGETKFDIIVLPEAAVPFISDALIYKRNKVRESFKNILNYEIEAQGEPAVSNLFWAQSIANFYQSEVVIGLDRRFKNSEDQWENQNAAFFLRPGGFNADSYAKQVLLPLAEYLPFSWLTPIVSRYGIQEFFSPGKEHKVFFGKVPFSTTICYEETFPRVVRKFRLNGAQLLVNLTNDGWYPNSSLPLQHLHLGRLRAVENGIPVIRSCNTGVSCVIDSGGKIQKIFSVNETDKGVLLANLSLTSHKTLYTVFGDWILIVICFVVLSFYLRKITKFDLKN